MAGNHNARFTNSCSSDFFQTNRRCREKKRREVSYFNVTGKQNHLILRTFSPPPPKKGKGPMNEFKAAWLASKIQNGGARRRNHDLHMWRQFSKGSATLWNLKTQLRLEFYNYFLKTNKKVMWLLEHKYVFVDTKCRLKDNNNSNNKMKIKFANSTGSILEELITTHGNTCFLPIVSIMRYHKTFAFNVFFAFRFEHESLRSPVEPTKMELDLTWLHLTSEA